MRIERRAPYWENFIEFCKTHNIVFGFDFDGVLFEPRIAASKRIFEDFRKLLPPEEFNTWTAVKDFLLREGVFRSEKRAEEYDRWIWTNALVLMDSPKVPGAFETTLELGKAGVPYYVYTSRLPHLAVPTFRTIKTHMPHIPLDRVFIRTDTMVSGEAFKAGMPPYLRVNVHLDDSWSQGEIIAEKNPNVKVMVMTTSDWQPRLPNLVKIEPLGRLPNFFDFYRQVVKNPEILLL